MTEPLPDTPPPAPAPGSSPGSITRPPIQYKGADLDSERGPGLGCFRFQLIVLAILVVLTPISVVAGWPELVSAVLLFIVIGLLLLTGQTMIFLMRLVAADRRSRRRPLASPTRTVGEIEDAASDVPPSAAAGAAPDGPGPDGADPAPDRADAADHPSGSDGVRQ